MNQPVKTAHAPVAEQRPHRHRLHDDERDDPWYWLRDRDDPAVTAYLDAENEYADAKTRHTEGLRTALYDDMLRRIKETDLSVPYRHGPYFYYDRTQKGQDYYCLYRSSDASGRDEQLILDVNALGASHDYFALGFFEPSPSHRYLAYATDTDGSEKFRLQIKNLESGETLPGTVNDVYYACAWSRDDAFLFFTTIDSAHRPWRVYRVARGESFEQAVLVFQEDDERFYVDVYDSLSGDFIFIECSSSVTTEVRYIDAGKPEADFKIVRSRKDGVEYAVTHHDEYFYIRHNDGAREFQLDRQAITAGPDAVLETVIAHRQDTYLFRTIAFANHLVIFERHAGLPAIRIRGFTDGADYYVSFDEEVYALWPDTNMEYQSELFRFNYSSLTTPTTTFDFDLNTQERVLLKQQSVLGGFSSNDYVGERIWATAKDGVKIPISLVRRHDAEGRRPLVLLGYGSYGANYPTGFSRTYLALLDRGISVAIAHVRGGSEMGRFWYDAGKLMEKKNSFLDFIAAAEHLVVSEYTASDRLAAIGGSAGGLLMGAVVNARPDLFKAVVAQVPFVDVLTTTLDESLPLTVIEWDEWGNPNDPKSYEYIKSYSPYDNVEPKDYPAMLVTAGLNDPRVSYFEPAKWVAKLRHTKTDNNTLLLKTNMSAGHGGASGRYEQLEEIAYEFAFIVDQIGDAAA